MRPFACALFAVLATVAPVAAQASTLEYTPPVAPPPPDLLGVLVRLVGLTVLTLVVCGGLIWWARRSTRKRLVAGNSAGRLVHEARLPLDASNAVHLIRVDGHPVVVTTDVTGLRSIVPVQHTFDAAFDAAADPEPEQALPTPPIPTPVPAE